MRQEYLELSRLAKKRIRVVEGAFLYQESVELGEGKFVNAYRLEAENDRVAFEIANLQKPTPLVSLVKSRRRVMAGINLGSMLVVDGKQKPVFSGYNLVLDKGSIWQYPSNTRPAAIVVNGNLFIKQVKNRGSIRIGNTYLRWVGSNVEEPLRRGTVKIFGIFDVDLVKKDGKRVIINTSGWVAPSNTELLLGCIKVRQEVTVREISKSKLNLLDFWFVIKGLRDDLSGIQIKDRVAGSLQGMKDSDVVSAVSLSFRLPRTIEQFRQSVSRELIPVNGRISVLDENYRKSWSVIAFRGSRVIMLVVDARPSIENQKGMNVFELHKFLYQDLGVNFAVCADSGQSGKLCVRMVDEIKVMSNLHYINLHNKMPFWDGIRGRPVSSALLVSTSQK